MALFADNKAVLASCVVIAGAFLGVNNTLITEAVMKVSDAERSTASAAYSFVRFTGGAIAPWLAGVLGEYSMHLAFLGGRGRGRRGDRGAGQRPRPAAGDRRSARSRR